MTYKKDEGNQGKTSKNDVKLHKAAHQSVELFPRGQLDNTSYLNYGRNMIQSQLLLLLL